MLYTEFPPSPALRAFVRCAWLFESDGPAVPERIVPDGRPELIVHFGAPYAEVDVQGSLTQPRALFAGQVTRPLTLRRTGPAGVVGIRFHPDGARAFLGLPLRTATDSRIALDDLWPGEGSRLAQAVARAGDSQERAAIAERFVRDRIALAAPGGDAIVRSCVAQIEESRGHVEPAALVAASGMGRRQLERRFADAVGIGPALLAMIYRFRSAFDLLEHDGARPWTEAALAAGYYDQSHFIREFRRFVGCTPTQFAAARPGLAAALVES